MKRKSRYNSTVGKLVFILPVIVIIVIGVYAFVSLNSPGTLIVEAQDASCVQLQENCPQLQVTATVNGAAHTTPTTLSLVQGSYTVDFGTMQFYYTPASSNVSVSPGHTTYAVGSYQPITKFIEVSGTGFNVTSVTVLHGVTPVVWANPTGSTVSFTGSPFSQVTLVPGDSYTYTFATPGNYQFFINSANATLTIKVQ